MEIIRHKRLTVIIITLMVSNIFLCAQGVSSEKENLPVDNASPFIERIMQKKNCLGLISVDEKTLREKFFNRYKENKHKKGR